MSQSESSLNDPALTLFDSIDEQLNEQEDKAAKKAARIEAERVNVESQVRAGKLDTITTRVAWILNNHSEARNSDITLLILYWQYFERENISGRVVELDQLYNLTPLTTIARSRATVQNTYRLYQASIEIRQRRGKLSEEERQKASEQAAVEQIFDFYDVYADETGKTAGANGYLTIGSVWITDLHETVLLAKEIRTWKEKNGFVNKIHFVKINEGNLDMHLDFLTKLDQRLTRVGYKAISVPRAGIKDVSEAIRILCLHLLQRGINHEHRERRAPLPRQLRFHKEQDDLGTDSLLTAYLRQELERTKFPGELRLGDFDCPTSDFAPVLELADLFAGSHNRLIEHGLNGTKAKDRFAQAFMARIGFTGHPIHSDTVGDIGVSMLL